MKIYIAMWTLLMASSPMTFAGRPIFLSDAEASIAADLIVIADIQTIENVPDGEPFEPDQQVVSESSIPFTQFTTITKFSVLLGAAPETISIDGGKVLSMTDFRLETGKSLLLLKKIGEGRYRTVDWNYGLMPVKEGKVEWILTQSPRKSEWISTEEALHRIKDNRAKNEQGD